MAADDSHPLPESNQQSSRAGASDSPSSTTVVSTAIVPRGQKFEATYDPNEGGPTGVFDLNDFKASMGPRNCVVSGREKAAIPPNAQFHRCDLRGDFKEINFKEVVFELCDFRGSVWSRVKFSKCHFRQCNFSYVTFNSCLFFDCRFSNNTASAEYFETAQTTIPATAFLDGLTPNTKHYPNNTKDEKDFIEYQIYRHRKTSAKLARIIHASTDKCPDPDIFSEAHKEVVLRSLNAKLEESRWSGDKKAYWLSSLVRSIPICVDIAVTWVSSLLTDWGRSIIRPLCFFATLVVIFSCFYHSMQWTSAIHATSWPQAVRRAIDISLVAGYTRHSSGTEAFEWIAFVNASLGIYWYTLIVPAIIKRVMR